MGDIRNISSYTFLELEKIKKNIKNERNRKQKAKNISPSLEKWWAAEREYKDSLKKSRRKE